MEEKIIVNGELGTAFRSLEQHLEKIKERQAIIASLQEEEKADIKRVEQLESKLLELKNLLK